MTGAMLDAAHLRDLAARMLALAVGAKDQPLREWLCIRAGDYLDQARVLEAAKPPAAGVEKKE
jgi:hypothetical protein